MKFKIGDYVKVVRLPNSKLDYQGWTNESYFKLSNVLADKILIDN